MPLTVLSVRNAKPSSKPYKLFDSGGLYLEVHPNQGRYWRFKYRVNGKEKRLALGVYPVVTLAMARDAAMEARRSLQEGVDPGMTKKLRVRAQKFGAAGAFDDAVVEGTAEEVGEDGEDVEGHGSA